MNPEAMDVVPGVMTTVWTFIDSTRVELLLFVAAVVAYFALFGNQLPRNTKLDAKKARFTGEGREITGDPELDPQECDRAEKSFRAAFDSGDHRTALRWWNVMKKFQAPPSVSLANVVESMQRFKKDSAFILRELRAFFKKYSDVCDIDFVNDLLEVLSKRLDSDLMDKIVELLPSLDLQADQRTYEIFLSMHFTTRSFQEVRALVAEMRANQIPFTTRSTVVVIKTALKMNNFGEALLYFRKLKMAWTTSAMTASTTTPSAAPRNVVSQLVELACKEHQLAEFLPELWGVSLTEEVINVMLLEAVRQKDASLTQSVEKLAREQSIPFSDATRSLLIKGLVCEPMRVREIVQEMLETKAEVSTELALAILFFCSHAQDIGMADRLYEHMRPKQLPVLSAYVRFYSENEQYEKACDVYEKDLQHLHTTDGAEPPRSLFLDGRMERSLMNAALRCGRGQLAKSLLDASPCDVAKHVTMIRNCAAEKNLQGAMSVFEALERSGMDLNGIIYNTVLDACVESRDLQAAEAWMERTKKAGMADVVSYNTLIKAHLLDENIDKARLLMEEMKADGLQPNRVTFNELINAMVTKRGQSDVQRARIWDFVEEMEASGVLPNQVTCSILLKSLNANSRQNDIMKTMDLINTMEEPMDEVLLSSVVEACVRIGQPDLLASKLRQLQDRQGSDSIAVNGSHTFGSLIKAYGHSKDIEGVWRCWKEMRSRHIKPTSITLGCMVEAVVSNGDTEGAYDLIHQMQDDEQCRDALNSVIYCSVLKGFTREKKMERVWQVYEEMNKRGIELSIVTYNTLIDACARCGRMDSVADIIDDMKKHEIRPNVITYSTMLKGHCQAGDIQMGFSILKQMKKDARLKPDEIMYNSLLDGCAQNNLVEEGLRLLEEMQREGVTPSNFTLSILVKLMNRARKLDNAFSLVDEITKKYRFRANVHVYTNLIQACVANRQLQRAMGVLEQMVRERVQPESRTYTILIRASITHNHLDQACALLRGALGLPGSPPCLAQAKALAACRNLDSAIVNEALVSFADRGRAQDLAAPLLADARQCGAKVRIDATTQRSIMVASVEGQGGVQTPSGGSAPSRSSRQRNGKGKGKGSWL